MYVKKYFSVFLIWFLFLTLPVFVYFVTEDGSFDRRTEAAIFNGLVNEFDEELQELEPNVDYMPGILRLEFPEGVSDEEIERIIGRERSTPEELKDTPFERVEYIEVNENNMAWEMAKFERYTSAEEVDLNYLFESTWREDGATRMLPNDWNAANHWYFNKIRLPEVWKLQGCSSSGSDRCGGSKDIIVAVIDLGLAFNAPEVQGMNIFSHSTYNRNQHIDQIGHGTYVIGVIASTTNNNVSSVGLAHNVTILPLKHDYSTRVIENLIYYAAKNADVINMSFSAVSRYSGCPPSSFQPLHESLTFASNRGVVLVSSSGNSGESCVGYPASDSRVIAVGSANANNSRSGYSQYGSNLDFVAPVGQGNSAGNATWQQSYSCFSTMYGCSSGSNFNSFANQYSIGTSFASPQVAGAVALILSLDPSLSPKQVKDVLIATVDDIGPKGKDAQFGYGLLNLEKIYHYLDSKLIFTGSPLSIKSGEEVALNWQAPHGSSCVASVGWTGSKANSGSEKVFPEKTTTYTLTCQTDADKFVESVTVTVEEMRLDFFAPITTIEPGGSTMLTWNSTGLSSCQASLGWSGSKELSGIEEVKPTVTTTYRLTCIQGQKDLVRTVQIRVADCNVNEDCNAEVPREICVKKFCVKGDVNGDGVINIGDFVLFKEDFIQHKTTGWSTDLARSDFNLDFRISMADYSIFVSSYRQARGS